MSLLFLKPYIFYHTSKKKIRRRTISKQRRLFQNLANRIPLPHIVNSNLDSRNNKSNAIKTREKKQKNTCTINTHVGVFRTSKQRKKSVVGQSKSDKFSKLLAEAMGKRKLEVGTTVYS